MGGGGNLGEEVLPKFIPNTESVITLITNQEMHLHKNFTLKHLKSLQHVSILRSSSGRYTVPC